MLLAQVQRATDEIMRSGPDSTLRLQTCTTFAAKWLIPWLQGQIRRYGAMP